MFFHLFVDFNMKKEFINNPTRLEMCIRSMLYDYRYKNKKDFFMCELSVIKKAFKNCLKSIKNMNQQGGSNINEINKLRNDLNELDKKIIEINKIL